MTIEIRHLRCFLAIYEVGNISRAALVLNVSQPALSRTLAQLELRLGTVLVDRSTHHLALTEAGTRFAVEARDVVDRFDRLIAGTTADIAPLRFGHSWSGMAYATSMIRAWHANYPERPFVSRRSDDRTAGLAAGRVDVALVRGEVDDRTLNFAVITHERRVAAVPVSHRLAQHPSVELGDMAGETLVVNTAAGSTTVSLWPGPLRPTVGTDTATIDDWLIAIATGAGVGVTAASTATLHPHPDVRFIPIDDAPLLPLIAIWPRRTFGRRDGHFAAAR
jgi:DNA-binding transcriptional LysR family regulator